LRNLKNYRGGTQKVEKNIPQKDPVGNCKKVETVQEEFTGKNLTGFGGAGLIRKFFKRHHLKR